MKQRPAAWLRWPARLALAAALLWPGSTALAQHHHHHMPMPAPSATPTPRPSPTATPTPAPSASSTPELPTSPQPSPTPVATPHAELDSADLMGAMTDELRLASGTSWQPAAAPMRMWMLMPEGWHVMVHGRADVAYDRTGGLRSDQAFLSRNWAMAMATTRLGPGYLSLRSMLTLEPATVPARGMPQLLQAGETYQNMLIRDHQHPHDFFMELSARYTWPLARDLSLFTYLALSGEPALGPPAFMHRITADENPWAPLSHHHQDNTHISFGVATLGLIWGPLKVDGSLFNGRDPDENRWDFDFGPLDSWSARVTVNPLDTLSVSASYGYLKAPEILHPGDVEKLEASVLWSQPIPMGTVSLGLLWGARYDPRGFLFHVPSHAIVFEGAATLARVAHLYFRSEFLDQEALNPFAPSAVNTVGAFTLGGVHDFYTGKDFVLGIGGDVTVSHPSPFIAASYGGDSPLSFHVFLRIVPPLGGE